MKQNGANKLSTCIDRTTPAVATSNEFHLLPPPKVLLGLFTTTPDSKIVRQLEKAPLLFGSGSDTVADKAPAFINAALLLPSLECSFKTVETSFSLEELVQKMRGLDGQRREGPEGEKNRSLGLV